MDNDDKYWLCFFIIIATLLLGLAIVSKLGNAHERSTKRLEFEAATKAGLVQRVDLATGCVIWVKPTE